MRRSSMLFAVLAAFAVVATAADGEQCDLPGAAESAGAEERPAGVAAERRRQ